MDEYQQYSEMWDARSAEVMAIAKVLAGALILLHGGALAALLSAFAESISDPEAAIDAGIRYAAFGFALGITTVVFAVLLAMLASRLRIPSYNQETKKLVLDANQGIADFIEKAAYLCAFASAAAVPVSMWLAAASFLMS